MTFEDMFTPKTMLIQCIAFMLVWAATHRAVRSRGPFLSVRTFTRLNSRAYSLLSFLYFCLIAGGAVASAGPFSGGGHDDLSARRIFHLSKFWEYVDVLGVCAAGGEVDLHFGFHHLTTPWLTHARVLSSSGTTRNDGWKWFAAANTAHHGLMYAYFGGWQRVRPVLEFTGEVQLLLGMLADAVYLAKGIWEAGMAGTSDDGDWTMEAWDFLAVQGWRFVFSASLLGTYLVLSRREMRRRERLRLEQQSDKEK